MAAQLAVDATLTDPALQDTLAAYGYDRTRLLEGQALYRQALALTQQRRAEAGAQFAATDARAAAHAQAHAVFMRHVTAARVALREDRGAAEKLDLAARKYTQAGWLLQAQQFYTNALADEAIVARLARYGATRELLMAAQDLVAAVADGMVAQHGRKAAAQETTRARDTALRALDRWMRDFMSIARIALKAQPQALEKLGVIVVRS
jgi:hypothetical protein